MLKRIKEYDNFELGWFVYFGVTNVMALIISLIGGMLLLYKDFDGSIIVAAASALMVRILIRSLYCIHEDKSIFFKILSVFVIVMFFSYWIFGIVINPEPKVCGLVCIIVAAISIVFIPIFYYRRAV